MVMNYTVEIAVSYWCKGDYRCKGDNLLLSVVYGETLINSRVSRCIHCRLATCRISVLFSSINYNY